MSWRKNELSFPVDEHTSRLGAVTWNAARICFHLPYSWYSFFPPLSLVSTFSEPRFPYSESAPGTFLNYTKLYSSYSKQTQCAYSWSVVCHPRDSRRRVSKKNWPRLGKRYPGWVLVTTREKRITCVPSYEDNPSSLARVQRVYSFLNNISWLNSTQLLFTAAVNQPSRISHGGNAIMLIIIIFCKPSQGSMDTKSAHETLHGNIGEWSILKRNLHLNRLKNLRKKEKNAWYFTISESLAKTLGFLHLIWEIILVIGFERWSLLIWFERCTFHLKGNVH